MRGMTHLPAAPAPAGRPRRSLPPKSGEGAESIFLLDAQPGRDLHLGKDQKVSAPSPTEMGGPQTGQPKNGGGLGARRNLEGLRAAFQQRNLDLDPQRRLG